MSSKNLKKNNHTYCCSHPILVGNEIFPCGKCINCRRKRVQEWANRMKLEFNTFKKIGVFVTMTYKDEYLPKGSVLVKKDLQCYIKRVRIHLKRDLNYQGFIRYFACGEYGSEKFTKRPHYHIVIFGLSLNEVIFKLLKKCWCHYDRKIKMYDSMGFTKIKRLGDRNFFYVAKYSVKSLNRQHKGVFEFTTMSRRKAIGSDYLLENKEKIFENKGIIKIGKIDFRAPRLFKKMFKEECQAHTKVTYNVVCNNDITCDDAFMIIQRYIANSSRNKIDENYFANFLKENKELRIVNFKDFMNNYDSNIQKEKSYMFKIEKSYYRFYIDNKQFFKKKFVDFETGECGGRDYIDFLNLCNNFKDRLIYYKTYEYI